jgi:very-short-patch-repair endonuclease
MNANDQDDERVWARADRTLAPPQRAFSRRMRKAPTEAERKLWWHLRHRLSVVGTHLRRQVQIGPYIVDFACHRSKLVIEIDGGQHGSSTQEDQQRTDRLQAEGYRVLRFWNNDVLSNVDGVLTVIHHALTTTPTPDPSPQGGGEKRAAPLSRSTPPLQNA